MSYLRFKGIALKILCIARPNRGTCKSIGARTRRRDVVRVRVHESPPRLCRAPPYYGRALKSGCDTGMRRPGALRAAASAGAEACHAAGTCARGAVLAPARMHAEGRHRTAH
jgi:hypothetical protein